MQAGADALARSAMGTHHVVSGTVRITASQPVACYVLPGLLARMRLSLPDVQVELVATNQVSPGALVRAELSEEAIALFLSFGYVPDPRGRLAALRRFFARAQAAQLAGDGAEPVAREPVAEDRREHRLHREDECRPGRAPRRSPRGSRHRGEAFADRLRDGRNERLDRRLDEPKARNLDELLTELLQSPQKRTVLVS